MPTDKTIEIDLTALTPEGLGQLIKIKEDIADELEKSGGRKKNKGKKGGNQTGQNNLKNKLLKKGNLGKNLLGMGTNPTGFISGLLRTGIPGLGAAIAATGIIVSIVKKIDDFEKKFIDNVDGRINLFRKKQQQALIQSGVQQLIITSASGSAEPRDAYNTFNEFNENQARIESDFRIRDTEGVD